MRRRTTILDVLREECARPQGEGAAPESVQDTPESAASASEDSQQSEEDEPEREAPRRRRRRRHHQDEAPAEASTRAAAETPRRGRRSEPEEDESYERPRRRRRRAEPETDDVRPAKASPAAPSPAEPPRTPRAVTTRPAGERPVGVRTEVQARRVTRATGRKRGLQVADWLQSDLSVPRGYVVAAAALLLFSMWGVFLLGRMNGSASGSQPGGQGIAKTSKASAKPSNMAPDLSNVKTITNEARLRRSVIGGYKIAEYPAGDGSKERLRVLHEHLTPLLTGSGATLRALQVVGANKEPKSFFLAVILPESLVGKAAGAADFFSERIQKAPVLRAGDFRFDFGRLEPKPLDVEELPKR